MTKIYTALGIMSGTSLDGIDFSIIQTDGEDHLSLTNNNYLEFSNNLKQKIRSIKSKITSTNECKKAIISDEYKELSNEITMFHQEGMIQTVGYSGGRPIDVIGFHGITLWHKPADRYTHQIGDAKLLKKSIAKYKNLKNSEIIFNFRENDILNGGQGAPLTPLYHQLILNKIKLNPPLALINIGGISNISYMKGYDKIIGFDAGPGNYLINKWIKLKANLEFDKDGIIAKSGKVNKDLLKKLLCDSYYKKKPPKSLDVKDFDFQRINQLSLQDGLATLSMLTVESIIMAINSFEKYPNKILVSGGGRKNKFIFNSIKKNIKSSMLLIDEFNFDGDFIESQAFAYLAIRSYLKKYITYPNITGVKKPSLGGTIFKS